MSEITNDNDDVILIQKLSEAAKKKHRYTDHVQGVITTRKPTPSSKLIRVASSRLNKAPSQMAKVRGLSVTDNSFLLDEFY